MIEIVWELLIKQDGAGKFELVFGPGGAWSKLYGGCDGFRGTTVLRDRENQRRYLVVDLWDAHDQRETALAENDAACADLEASLDALCESRKELGIFRVLAQATVRPRSSAGRRRGRDASQTGRRTSQ